MDNKLHAILNSQQANHWWFAGRKRIFFDVLKRNLHGVSNNILDVGCGTGGMLDLLQNFGHSTGVEISPEAVEYARRKGYSQVIQNDAKCLPFPDAHFDVVVAFDLIEHMKDDCGFVAEVVRVLKPGGVLFLSTAAFNFLWSAFDQRAHHFRRYTKQSLKKVLAPQPLSCTIQYYNIFLFPVIALIRIFEKVFPRRGSVGELYELRQPQRIINSSMKTLLSLERYFTTLSIPFGVSLYAVCKKSAVIQNKFMPHISSHN